MQHASDRNAPIIVDWAVVRKAIVDELHHDYTINGAR